jgi:hypothetical protein
MSLKLTAQLYKQILASLKSDSPERNSEKRTQGRVGLRCTLEIIPLKGGKPITVWVRDISEQGIGLVSPAVVGEGTIFIARLPREKGEPLIVSYKVCYCRHLSSELYSLGCRLEAIEKKDDKSSADKPAAAAPAGKVAVGAVR